MSPKKDQIRHNDISRKIVEDNPTDINEARKLFNRAAGTNRDNLFEERKPIEAINPIFLIILAFGILCLAFVAAFLGYIIMV